MKRHMTLIVLALSAASAAQAAMSISSPALTVVALPNGMYDNIDLVSGTKTATAVSMTGMNNLLHFSRGPDSSNTGDQSIGEYEVTVQPGYVVTGFSLTGTFAGSIQQLQALGNFTYAGSTHNNMRAFLSAYSSLYGTAGRTTYTDQSTSVSNSTSSTSFALDSGAVNLAGSFIVYASGGAYVEEWPWEYKSCNEVYGCHYTGVIPYQVSASVSNSMLTFTTQPVPEPSTYATLMAGLLVLGASTVRRKRG